MSGLLSDASDPEDINTILEIAEAIAQRWETSFAEEWGFTLSYSKTAAIQCSKEGAELFSDGIFSDPPGPFKRTAAFLVLARLNNLFEFNGKMAPEVGSNSFRAWQARICVFLIPIVLEHLVVTINGQDVVLDKWNRFSSNHFRLEFIAWIKSLDLTDGNKAQPGEVELSIKKHRTARIVMGCALILESSYYLQEALDELDQIRNGKAPGPRRIQGQDEACMEKAKTIEELATDLWYETDKLWFKDGKFLGAGG